MNAPRISVGLPIYNAGRFLVPALESVLRQTRGDFELLALDDGSTDGSQAVLKAFAERDPRIRPFYCEHGGLVRNLNTAIAEARGEFFARMDADDVALPERFAQQTAYLDAHPRCAAVGAQILQIDADDDPLSPMPVPCDHAAIERQLLAGRGSALVHAAATFRTAALRAIHGYRPEFETAEDLDLYLRLAENWELANLETTLFLVRRHPNSVTAVGRQQQIRALKLAIVAEAHARRGEEANSTARFRAIWQPETLAEAHLTWALAAARAGHWRTARKYTRHLLGDVYRRPRELAALAAACGGRLLPLLLRRAARAN